VLDINEKRGSQSHRKVLRAFPAPLTRFEEEGALRRVASRRERVRRALDQMHPSASWALFQGRKRVRTWSEQLFLAADLLARPWGS
jgi:hypothetical protein